MNLKEFNSLTDLFFYQAEKQNPKSIFLKWLNPKNKRSFTWAETVSNIYKLAKILKQYVITVVYVHTAEKQTHSLAGDMKWQLTKSIPT